MDEWNMLEKIAESARNLEVPEALRPEQIQERLQNKRVTIKKRKWYRSLAAAACLCLCFSIGRLVYQNHVSSQEKNGMAEVNENSTVQQTESDSEVLAPVKEAPMKKIGKIYTLASDYGEVYDVLKKTDMRQVYKNERKDAAIAVSESDMQNTGNMIMDEAADFGAVTASEDSAKEFSSTNLQTEDVDESDIVKTDGRYIYVVQEAGIQVLDIRSQMPKTAVVIEPELDEDTDRVCEMYVADNRLTVILQAEQTILKEQENFLNGRQSDMEDKVVQTDAADAGKSRGLRMDFDAEDVQYISTTAITKAVTYDITDPQNPVLQDEVSQDGWYQDSRKIGNRLYLFTNQELRLTEGLSREDAVKEDSLELWLPCVDEKPVSADCIYLPKEGNEGLLMSSIDLDDHHKVVDTKMLVNSRAQLYMSQNSVYLYYNDYTNEAVKTRIVRFALESDGTIRAKAAKTLKGMIEDTFAIHEREGYLQVLTSITSSDPWENRVYVLDENLKLAGRLTGLAKGERIYSARFLGNIGYFVTYQNTDPLFTVDFTDPRNPKVIGKLKVTGFSEYLHFWSDDRMLGIGLETNPDSGETIGVKLSMFDISNPAKVTEEARFVMEDAQNCEAMYDYKSVLVNRDKNIITLITESHRGIYKEDFRVFSYENGKFISRAVRPLAAGNKDYEESRWRSLFVGDMLYLVSEKKVIAFDMKQEWNEIGKLVYAK